MKKTNSSPFGANYQHVKYKMALGFSLAFIVVSTVLTVTFLLHTNALMTKKVLSLADNIAGQIVISMNSIIGNQENMMNVLFLPEGEPVPGAVSNDNELSVVFMSRFRSLQNFRNFALVYSDGTISGNLDDASIAALGKPLFAVLSSFLKSQNEDWGWITDDDLSSGQVFFLRRLSPSIIVLSSLAVSEFDRNITGNQVVSNPFIFRVISPNGMVLYSTNKNESGNCLDVGEVGLLYSRLNKPQIQNKQVSVVQKCDNGWIVTLTAETSEILKEQATMLRFFVITLFIVCSFIIIFCIAFSMNLTMPIDTLVRRLYEQSIRDSDTKLFLKDHFGECVKSRLENQSSEKYAMIQIDIDNYKQMHDMRGNTFCTRIISELADAMLATFPEDSIFGRIGHDRFMVFARLPGDSFQSIHHWCLAINDSFRERVEKTENATGVSVSCGVVLVPEHGTDFDMICELSDRAVFAIKRDGKNGYHIYNDDDMNLWK